MIVLEKIDEVYFQIKCPIEIALEIRNKFNFYTKNYKYHPKFKCGMWNGKISLFEFSTNKFPIGLLYELLNFFEKSHYQYKIEGNFEEFIDETITKDAVLEFSHKIFKNSNFFPRDYQLTAIENALLNKRGIIESPTGSGKSLIIYVILRYLLDKIPSNLLLIVPSINLVEQMFSDFFDYGWNDAEEFVDILYHGKKIKNKRILVSTYQSLVNKDSSFFENFGGILMDECHGLSIDSKSLREIMIKTKKSFYKFGFTGTLPDDKLDLYTIFGFLGPQIFKLKTHELMDKGILSKIKIINILFKYSKDIIKKYKKISYPEEERLVENDPKRFRLFDFIFKSINDEENTLILCRHIDHLNAIESYLVENLDEKFKICKIYGEINPTQREKLRKLMEVEKNMILIGTYGTMKQGVNIRRIHNVIFASSYKSKITILQSIGRGIRTYENKEYLLLWDIVDDLRWMTNRGNEKHNHLFKHYLERVKYYENQKFTFDTLKIDYEGI